MRDTAGTTGADSELRLATCGFGGTSGKLDEDVVVEGVRCKMWRTGGAEAVAAAPPAGGADGVGGSLVGRDGESEGLVLDGVVDGRRFGTPDADPGGVRTDPDGERRAID